MKITCQTCGRWLRNEMALTRCLLAGHTLPKHDSLAPPYAFGDDAAQVDVYIDIKLLEDPSIREDSIKAIREDVRREPIVCKTCGQTLDCMADAFRCLADEHQLPTVDELPPSIHAGKVSLALEYTLFLFEYEQAGFARLRQGKSGAIKVT